MIYLSIVYSIFPKVIRRLWQLMFGKGEENIKQSETVELVDLDEDLTNDAVLFNYYSNKVKTNRELLLKRILVRPAKCSHILLFSFLFILHFYFFIYFTFLFFYFYFLFYFFLLQNFTICL